MIGNTLEFVVLYIPLMLIAAMIVALILNSHVKGVGIFRVLYYIPVITSWVAGALIWKWVLSPEYGAINNILALFGIEGPSWLQSSKWAMPAIVLASVWKDMGYFGLMLMSGLQGINQEYYDAAAIDGAGKIKQFTRITLPLLTPTLFFVLIISLAKPNGGPFAVGDFDYSESAYWPNPQEMIEKLHKAGLHLVLWQVPVYKQQGDDEIRNHQNDLDREDAVKRSLCIHDLDGTPYKIPEGHWFPGSMIPDFTNPETCKTWFGKRQYLLDMGVDGFKTDGGEFVCTDAVSFYDGSTGKESRNCYPQQYTKAYTKFLGDNHVLFSRAGYMGQHTTPCHWGGDRLRLCRYVSGCRQCRVYRLPGTMDRDPRPPHQKATYV